MTSQTILITGATSGIGQALAYMAADYGYKVIACGRNKIKLDIIQQHPNISACQFDVCDEQASVTALQDLHFDIAVLNAGTCEYVDVNQFEPALFKRVFDANFFGVINTYNALKDKLKPGNQVVIIDSLARLLPFTRCQAYGASKSALYYFTKCLEVDLHHQGIIVQSISPGFVETPLTDKNDFEMPMKIPVEEAAKRILKGIIKKRKSLFFPRRFSLLLRIMGLLPASSQRWIALRLKQQQSAHHEK